jgi:hypothetical protein
MPIYNTGKNMKFLQNCPENSSEMCKSNYQLKATKTPTPKSAAAPLTAFPFYSPLVLFPAESEESRQMFKIFTPNLKISRQI